MRKKVACIFGGVSSEYEISLKSAASVIRNINEKKYECIMIGITKDGTIYLYNGPVDKIEIDEWNKNEYCKKITFSTNRCDHGFIILETNEIVRIDVVFPILHGMNGEDGRLQGLFEISNIPCVGCDMISSAICMDKFIAHELVSKNGISTPKSYLFDKSYNYFTIKDKIKELNLPIFVKPLKAGSSFGITKVNKESELMDAINLAFKYDDKIIIEENIDGVEVGVAILGNNELIVGEVDEIELSNGFFDTTEKYNLITSKIIIPANIDAKERERIKQTAIKIYKILNCKCFARVDMFYTIDKKIVFNEVNTIPGFTSHSRYPSMLKSKGYEFEWVIDRLISLGLENERI